MDLFNIKIGSIGDFINAYNNAKPAYKAILEKAFPKLYETYRQNKQSLKETHPILAGQQQAIENIIDTLTHPSGSITKLGKRLATDIEEAKYKAWENQDKNFGFDPKYIKPLTQQQADKVLDWSNKQVAKEEALRDKAEEDYWKARLANRQVQEMRDKILTGQVPLNNPPQSNLDFTNIPQQAQNAQQGVLNNNLISQVPIDNQQAVTGQQITSPSIPNITTNSNLYNIGAQMDLQDLYNRVQQPQQVQRVAPVPVDNTGLQAYMNFLGQQNQAAQLKIQQAKNIYEDLINQYQQAALLDREQNTRNRVSNAFNALLSSNNVPISYVGANGDLRTIQPTNFEYQPLPTNTTTNVNQFANMLKLRQLQAEAANKVNTNQAQQVRDALTAQALGEQFRVNPLVFLDEKTRGNYLQYIVNPNIANQAQFAREAGLVPLTTQGKIAEQQAKIAGDLEIENLKGKYGLAEQGLENTGALRRAQLQGDYDYAIQRLKNTSAEEIARITGANQREALRLEDALKSDNPIEQMKAVGVIMNAMGQTGDYTGGLNAFNLLRGANLFNLNASQQQPLIVPNNTTMTPEQYQALFNAGRNR